MKTLWLLLTVVAVTCSVVAMDDDSTAVILRAVMGKDAHIPCGDGQVFLDGPAAYVLWLKNDNDLIYRFPDANRLTRSLPITGSLNSVYGETCIGNKCFEDTTLVLKDVDENDCGIYICRIHYQRKRSVDHIVNVTLVGDRGKPKLYDSFGSEIKTKYMGPLNLGANAILLCEVPDEPGTMMGVKRNGVMVARAEPVSSGVLRAEVCFSNVSRDELGARYTCVADSLDARLPSVASVVVDMNLPPLSVEIRLDDNLNFEAGKPRVADCVVVGCVPPPVITWMLGGKLLRSRVHMERHDGNFTMSSLTLSLSERDNGRELVCSARNPRIPDKTYDAKVIVNVGHPPKCLEEKEVELGIVHGEVETVTCPVEAVPAPSRVSWTFANSQQRYTSAEKTPGHRDLYTGTLTWTANKNDVGILTCRAINAFGEQAAPCYVKLLPGGAPKQPTCVLTQTQAYTVRVNCGKGWNGGRPQTIHLEFFDAKHKMLYNGTNTTGHFLVEGLEPNRNFTAEVFAANVRGRSAKLHMPFTTSEIPKSYTFDPDEDTSRPTLIGKWMNIISTTSAIMILVVMISICVKGACTRRYRGSHGTTEQTEDSIERADGVFHREPDFARDERALTTTNITVNQMPSYEYTYTANPPTVQTFRVLVGGPSEPEPVAAAPQHSYYV